MSLEKRGGSYKEESVQEKDYRESSTYQHLFSKPLKLQHH